VQCGASTHVRPVALNRIGSGRVRKDKDRLTKLVRTLIHFIFDWGPACGGPFTTVKHFLGAAESLDWEWGLVSIDSNREPKQPREPENEGNHHQILRLTAKDGYFAEAYRVPARFCLEELRERVARADVVFIHMLYRYHVGLACELSERLGKPVVIVPHGGLDPYCFTYRSFRKRAWLSFHFRHMKKAWFLFATDAERRKAMSQVKWISSDRTRIINWPVSHDGVQELAVGSAEDIFRTTTRKLLFAGRLHPMKRIIETVAAFRDIQPPGWELVIAGPESKEVRLADVIRHSGPAYGRSIHYVGFLNPGELRWVSQRCDAFVLASHRENFGNSVAEAMIAGLGVGISDGVDIHELVSRRKCGIVSHITGKNDVRKLLTSLCALPRDELKGMGLRGRAAAAKAFSFEQFASALRDFVETVVADSGVGSSKSF